MRLQQTKRLLGWFGCVALALSLGACENVWEWTVDEESYDALMSRGRDALREENYVLAEEKFSAAVALEPANSDARYYLAKAAVLRANVDVYFLVDSLTDDDGRSGVTEIFAFDVPKANAIFGANWVVLQNLEPIRRGLAPDGAFTAKDVDLDLSVAYILRAILRLRDSNGDGIIDDTDLALSDFLLANGAGGFTLEGLQNLQPGEINAMLTDVALLLLEGSDLLAGVLDDTGVDVQGLQDLTGALRGDIGAYYVNNGIVGNPGEGDNDGDGVVDEECFNGVDDDGDGAVDEDSRLAGC